MSTPVDVRAVLDNIACGAPAGHDFRMARAAVAELIEVLDVVETWMDVHALPALGDDTDGGHTLLANVREVLALARGTPNNG